MLVVVAVLTWRRIVDIQSGVEAKVTPEAQDKKQQITFQQFNQCTNTSKAVEVINARHNPSEEELANTNRTSWKTAYVAMALHQRLLTRQRPTCTREGKSPNLVVDCRIGRVILVNYWTGKWP